MELLPDEVQIYFAWLMVISATLVTAIGIVYFGWWAAQRVRKFRDAQQSTFDE